MTDGKAIKANLDETPNFKCKKSKKKFYSAQVNKFNAPDLTDF